jgi:hypothetical protein
MRRTKARGGGTNGCLKRKVFLKNQKHQPNIVEITHLCIMHGVHTSTLLKDTYAPSFLSSCCGNGGQHISITTLNCSHKSFDVYNQNSPRLFHIQGSIEKASEWYTSEGNMQYFLKY